MTFEVEEGFKRSKNQHGVFFMDEDNVLEDLEKLMEEEIQIRDNPKEEVKLAKPRVSIQMVFGVLAFTTLKVQVEEPNEIEDSSDEEDDHKSIDTKLD